MSLAAAAAAMAAKASKLPSPPQVVKPVSVALIVGLFTLALLRTSWADEELATEWETPPALETFASYEEMQHYFDHRNQRRLRHIENPSGDSYIEAYNQHNEQEEYRVKRSTSGHQELKQQKEQQPALIRFEMADAVEPSEEVKQLIRQYKSRELQQNKKYMETVPLSNSQNTEIIDKSKIKRTSTNEKSKQEYFGQRLARSKRTTPHQQPPANFKVKYIPFEVTDAREPDAHTKNLIKRMRALEIERITKELPLSNPSSKPQAQQVDSTTSTTKKPLRKRSKLQRQWKPKRIKREAAAPEMIKFEIGDAKDPDPSLRTFMKTKPEREAKDLKMQTAANTNPAGSADAVTSDQNAQATKRYFVYKEAPTKIKKSINEVPHDVQNIISNLIKGAGGGGGKAYLKYIPAQQVDYNNLKAAYPIAKGGGGPYGQGGAGGYGKFVRAVPVKFVYHPVPVGAVGGHGAGYEGAGGVGHEGGGAALAVPVKYVAVGGGEVGYGGGGGGEGGYSGGYGDGGGGGYKAGGVAVKYVAAVGGEGVYAAADAGEGGGEEAYAAPVDDGYDAGGNGGEHEGGGQVAGYVAGLGAHANYVVYGGGHGGGSGGQGHAGGGGGYIAAHAPVSIAQPIVVADAGAGQAKVAAYSAGFADGLKAENGGNDAIKNIPAPQFKGETKYSVIPTVEQYAKTPTQEFQLKLYSPESLIAKAQLEAKDKANAIAAEGQKELAAAYNVAAEKGVNEFGGGYGAAKGAAGYGAAKVGAGYGGAKVGLGFKIGGGGKGGGGGGGGYESGEAAAGEGGGYGGNKAGAGFSSGGGAGPVIKIEYHAPAESYKGNYKDIPEFHQLSSLVGKSPEDQIHGLTYLLAKEMQNRLHLQRQQDYGKGAGGYGGEKGFAGGYGGNGEGLAVRPQDNKAPQLFHPGDAAAKGGGGAGGKSNGGGSGGFYQPIVGKYMGMAKSKQYIPVMEQGAAEELKGVGAEGGFGYKAVGGGKLAGSSYGLSPNYKGLGGLKGFAGGMGLKAAAGGDEEFVKANGYDEAAAKLQSYASKYAFGYRIRDFSTGNDFGHKQNRDLHGVTRGQYHILLPDGRIQNVIYHADDTGFHADVSFESGR